MAEDSKEKTLLCSFCGKNQTEVKKLIAGPSVFICDECVDLCNDIIVEENDVETASFDVKNRVLTIPTFEEKNKSKYEILDLGTGRAYAFDRNEPWTHIQDIFFMNDKTLSFVLSANGSITRYLCDENK